MIPPLISISDDGQLDAALATYERLTTTASPSAGQLAYLRTLVDLIDIYEEAHVRIPEATGRDVVLHLMEANDLKQKDMDFAFGNKAVTSANLRGRRPIGVVHARRLSERFKLPLDVFLGANAHAPQTPPPTTGSPRSYRQRSTTGEDPSATQDAPRRPISSRSAAESGADAPR